jgi:hypothetical protein
MPGKATDSAVCWERLPKSKAVKFLRQGKGGRTQVWCLGPTPRLPGESSTLNISACPNDAKGSSLWQVLEKPRDPSDLKPYYLSAEQKATVLRNAGLRGSPLPELLERALKNS